MSVRIQLEDFDIGNELRALREGNPKIGAVASFIGLMRDLNDAAQVVEMTLEHYPGMTEKALLDIVGQAKTRWNLIDALVVHRYGSLKPMDQIVLVMVAGSHRGEAFAACEFIMDYLKTGAPFWKKETTAEGTRWVAARESDDSAAGRWKQTETGGPTLPLGK
ncbi:MAG: molybdenum cofactor biosynthesis protein MoaE [Burkholderiales bacterium]|nr:molybdenum cofactor biosynthesis protein MoaE [Burkholderiales bacterium]